MREYEMRARPTSMKREETCALVTKKGESKISPRHSSECIVISCNECWGSLRPLGYALSVSGRTESTSSHRDGCLVSTECATREPCHRQ